jgi:hypothetical protein
MKISSFYAKSDEYRMSNIQMNMNAKFAKIRLCESFRNGECSYSLEINEAHSGFSWLILLGYNLLLFAD